MTNSMLDNGMLIVWYIETLIVWTEGPQVDLALSFQEADGCEYIWYVLLRDRLECIVSTLFSLGNGYKKSMKTASNFHLPSVSVIFRHNILSITPSFTIFICVSLPQLPIQTMRIHHLLGNLMNLMFCLLLSYRIYHRSQISYQMQRQYKKRIDWHHLLSRRCVLDTNTDRHQADCYW